MSLEKESSSVPVGRNVLKTRSGIYEALGKSMPKEKKNESCSTAMQVDASLLQQIMQEYENDLKTVKSSSQEMDSLLFEYEQSDEMRKKCTSVFDECTKQVLEESLTRQFKPGAKVEAKDYKDPHYMAAIHLIKEERGLAVINNLDDFPEKYYKEFALLMIANNQAELLGRHMFAFKHLDKEVAEKMIEAGQGHYVASTLFPQVNPVFEIDDEIGLKLIRADQKTGYAVIDNLSRFSPEYYIELIDALFETENIHAITRHLRVIKPFLNKSFLFRLIKEGQIRVVAQRLDLFSGLDKEIAMEIIDLGYAHWVGMHIKHFKGLDREVAEKMIRMGEKDTVERYPNFFGLKKGTGLFEKMQGIAQGIIRKK